MVVTPIVMMRHYIVRSRFGQCFYYGRISQHGEGKVCFTHSQTNTLTCTHSHIKQRQSFTGYFFFSHTHALFLPRIHFSRRNTLFPLSFSPLPPNPFPPIFGARINSTRKDDNITKYDADCVTGEPHTHTQPCVPLAAGCGSVFAA